MVQGKDQRGARGGGGGEGGEGARRRKEKELRLGVSHGNPLMNILKGPPPAHTRTRVHAHARIRAPSRACKAEDVDISLLAFIHPAG